MFPDSISNLNMSLYNSKLIGFNYFSSISSFLCCTHILSSYWIYVSCNLYLINIWQWNFCAVGTIYNSIMIFTNVRIWIVNRINVRNKFPFLVLFIDKECICHLNIQITIQKVMRSFIEPFYIRTFFYWKLSDWRRIIMRILKFYPFNDISESTTVILHCFLRLIKILTLAYCCTVNLFDFTLNYYSIFFLLRHSWCSWSLPSAWHWISNEVRIMISAKIILGFFRKYM